MMKLSEIRCETCPHYRPWGYQNQSSGQCLNMRSNIYTVRDNHACAFHPLWQQALVEEKTPSRCPKHPRYQAKRKPTSDCEHCRAVWERKMSDEAQAKGTKMKIDATRKKYYEAERRYARGSKTLAEKLDEHFAARGWEDRYSGSANAEETSLIRCALSEVERFERGGFGLTPGGRSLGQARSLGSPHNDHFEEGEA